MKLPEENMFRAEKEIDQDGLDGSAYEIEPSVAEGENKEQSFSV